MRRRARLRAPTAFERRVYAVVTRIPRGEVRSYQWVADAIGCPSAARAVGNALRRNPFAPRVPCHRVVRSDGTVGGYARGVARKRALLQQEGWRPPHERRSARRRSSASPAKPRRSFSTGQRYAFVSPPQVGYTGGHFYVA